MFSLNLKENVALFVLQEKVQNTNFFFSVLCCFSKAKKYLKESD